MSDAAVDLPEELKAFLGDATPAEWVAEALRQPEVLLLDHASCELKAASTASIFSMISESGSGRP